MCSSLAKHSNLLLLGSTSATVMPDLLTAERGVRRLTVERLPVELSVSGVATDGEQ